VAGSAYARDVKISGTHGVSDIEIHCINNGGTFFNTTGGATAVPDPEGVPSPARIKENALARFRVLRGAAARTAIDRINPVEPALQIA
jgi:hypothetical protein